MENKNGNGNYTWTGSTGIADLKRIVPCSWVVTIVIYTSDRSWSGPSFVRAPGGEVLLYMGYIPKAYGFLAILVIIGVSILADFDRFGHKWVWFLYSNLDMGMFWSWEPLFYH